MTTRYTPEQMRQRAIELEESSVAPGEIDDVGLADAAMLRQAANDAADAARWRHFAAHTEIVNRARGVYLEMRVMFGRQDDKPADYVDAMIAVDKTAE